MAIADTIDFEGAQESSGATNQPQVNLGEDKSSLNYNDADDITQKSNEQKVDSAVDNSKDNDNTPAKEIDENKVTETPASTPSTGGLPKGTEVEYDNKLYVVNDNGDLVDKEGNVFVKASDLDKWIADNQAHEESEEELSFSAIKDAVGINITDEQGKDIEFANTPEGVKEYVKSVIDLKTSEIQEATLNKLYADNPLVKLFIDYVQVNGSAEGFGDIPDRSNIELDPRNETQLEAVIRMAAKEFGNKSLNDNYIKYLKESGSLYDEAKSLLSALVGKDKAYKKEIEEKARLAREKEEREITEYWKSVSDAIDKGVIGKYKLPDTFVVEKNGKKITQNLKDFYRYISESSVVDENGNKMTQYQNDLRNLSNEDALNKELLDAWLSFTGGTYKDLVAMAINEEKVKRLIVKAKQQKVSSVLKVNKPKNNSEKEQLKNIYLGE